MMRSADNPPVSADGPPAPVMVVAQAARDANAVRRQLEALYPIVECASGAEALARLAHVEPSCVVIVDGLPDMSTPDLLTAIGARGGRHPCPTVVIGGGRDTDVAIRVLKSGAQDFLHRRKLRDKSLVLSVRNALQTASLHRQLDAQRRELDRQREWLAVTLAIFQLTLIMRLVRAQMLETLRSDFVKFARARGLPEWRIEIRHALRNTLLPVVTIIGLQFGAVIAFAIVTESVFQWPGLGALFVQAVQFVDIPVIAAYLLFVALVFVVTNLAVDLAYLALDPRLRTGHEVARR